MTGLPSSSWNNAVCSVNGTVYMLENGTQKLWEINLHTLAVTSVTLTGMSDSPGISIWGDLAIDPIIMDKLYRRQILVSWGAKPSCPVTRPMPIMNRA